MASPIKIEDNSKNSIKQNKLLSSSSFESTPHKQSYISNSIKSLSINSICLSINPN